MVLYNSFFSLGAIQRRALRATAFGSVRRRFAKACADARMSFTHIHYDIWVFSVQLYFFSSKPHAFHAYKCALKPRGMPI